MCENLAFIGHLCEICSMCEYMAIWCLGSVSKPLCSVSDGQYTKSSNCLVSTEEKGGHALNTHVSHLEQRETHS
jgi:hypothetical protein